MLLASDKEYGSCKLLCPPAAHERSCGSSKSSSANPDDLLQ